MKSSAMDVELDINNNYNRRQTELRSSVTMFRRSISLVDASSTDLYLKLKDNSLDYEDCQELQKPKLKRHMSLQKARQDQVTDRPMIRQDSFMSLGSATTQYEFANERSIGPLASIYFESYFDVYIRFVIVPVAIIFFMGYTFFHLPVAPKAEIYRSLSATFVLLVGIMVQCCCLTIWASRRYGFNELVAFLRFCLTTSHLPQST